VAFITPSIIYKIDFIHSMKQQTKAYTFALGAVLLWSFVATAFKIALKEVDIYQLLFYGNLTAFLVLLIIFLLEKRIKELQRLSVKSIVISSLRGFLNPFLYYLILFEAYDILPAQEAMSLNYIWPIVLVLLAAPILKQKINLFGFMGIIISFIGVILIATKGNPLELEFENLRGDILAFSSSIVWAFFWLSNMKSKESETTKLLLSFGFGLIFSLAAVIFFSDFTLPSLSSSFALIYVGIAEMGLTFYLWLNALKHSKRADQVSKLIYLSPFLSLIFIAIILHEKIGIFTFIGLAMIIIGILIKDRKK